MSERPISQPMGPLQEGDQAIIDALHRIPVVDAAIYRTLHEAVITDLVSNRETTPGIPKDHWSVTSLDTDDEGMPTKVESTLLTVSSKDINVTLRGGDVSDLELRTEEDKPKATERAKLHDRETEQAIKLLTAQRLGRAADIITRIQTKELQR